MPDYLGREGEFGGEGRGSVVRHRGEIPAQAVVTAKPPPLAWTLLHGCFCVSVERDRVH